MPLFEKNSIYFQILFSEVGATRQSADPPIRGAANREVCDVGRQKSVKRAKNAPVRQKTRVFICVFFGDML